MNTNVLKLAVVTLSATFILSGCTAQSTSTNNLETQNIVENTIEEQISSTDQVALIQAENAKQEEMVSEAIEESSSEGVDIDLTKMSTEMVFSTVSQMWYNPQAFDGNVVKMRGLYNPHYYEKLDKVYHNLLIMDALGCCPQGVEFVWGDGSHVYPDEYPEVNTELEVIGVFETYEEEGYTYFRLKDASMTIIE